jgi:hypothetical protein
MSDAALSWRIPEGSGRTSLRFALTQIAFVTVVVGTLIIFLTPAQAQSGLLAATMAIALALAAVQTFRAWGAASGPPNVWLDDAGLHWRDRSGAEQLLARTLIRGFQIGHDEETRRDLASLTLVLAGDFLSQPVELHAPADEARVRQWLQERWSLAEAGVPESPRRSLGVFSELDFQRQIWLLEGARPELMSLAQAWSEAASVPLPPLGGRPKQWELDFDGAPLTLAIAPHTWLDDGYLSATPEMLRHLAGEVSRQLSADKPQAEFEIPLAADSGHRWRILVAVADDKPQVE